MAKPNIFMRLILWLSNTNYTIYNNCSDNIKGKRIALSLFVLVTGVISGISGSYLIRTIFSDFNEVSQNYEVSLVTWLLSLMIGVIWMTCIMLMDRTIIASRSRLTALLRIPLALTIGFIVAKPVEVQLFSKTINKSLMEESQVENKDHYDRYTRTLDNLENDIINLKRSITEHKKKMVDWQSVMEAEVVGRVQQGRTGIAGTGPAWEAANKNYNLHKDLCAAEEIELDQLLLNQNTVKEEAKNTLKSEVIRQSFDFVTQYKKLQELQKEDKSLNLLALGLTALFILIELIPAIMKLTNEKDSYDHMELSFETLNAQTINAMTNFHMAEIEKNLKNQSVINDESLPCNIIPQIIKNLQK